MDVKKLRLAHTQSYPLRKIEHAVVLLRSNDFVSRTVCGREVHQAWRSKLFPMRSENACRKCVQSIEVSRRRRPFDPRSPKKKWGVAESNEGAYVGF